MEGITIMTGVPMPTESIAKVDLLLGQATMLTADRWDDLPAMIHEAMGISLLMAVTQPSSRPVDIPGLARLTALECVESALREVHTWDLALAADLPDLARLRVLLADVRGELDSIVGRRG